MIGRIPGYPLFFLPFVRPISDVSIGERARRKGAGEGREKPAEAEEVEEEEEKAAEGVRGRRGGREGGSCEGRKLAA